MHAQLVRTQNLDKFPSAVDRGKDDLEDAVVKLWVNIDSFKLSSL